MYHELTLEFDFPYLRARYGEDVVAEPLSLALENHPFLPLLDNLDQFEPVHRERVLVEIGQQLFEALIPSGVLPLYLRSMAAQRQKAGVSLRIRIVANDTRLLTLPWEFMYDCRQVVFPASALETPIVRTLGEIQSGAALTPFERPRILLVGASPTDAGELRYQDELDAIVAVTSGTGVQVEVLPAATASAFREKLTTFTPHVVHFMGHGFSDAQGSGIFLEDRRRSTHRVSGELLARWLEPAAPRLVVLNACESARLQDTEQRGSVAATLLRAGIPAVLAMQYRIPDSAGVIFGPAFFEPLCRGRTLERALQGGRYALLVEGGLLQRHFATPVLYLAHQLGGRLIEGEAASTVLPAFAATTRRPFRYLESFGREDYGLFFGRSKAIEALANRVATHPLLVVHGRSGVGKTSLLQAGFEQSAARSLYYPVTLRFVQDPVKALEEALEAALRSIPARRSDLAAATTASLVAFTALSGGQPTRGGSGPGGGPEPVGSEPPDLPLHVARKIQQFQRQSGRTVLLVLDQFEEFFTVLPREAQDAFLDLLHALYTDLELKLRIVLVIREDFFFALEQIKERFPIIMRNTYSLGPLTRAEAQDALVGPLNSLDIRFELELIQRILSDLWREDVGVDPVQLQIVGHHLHEKCEALGQKDLTLATYLELGGASGILQLYLTHFMQKLPEQEQTLIQSVLERFITRQGTRQPVTVAEICQALEQPVEMVRDLLARLAEARLVRRVEAVGEGEHVADELQARWEISHEVLIPAIQQNRRGIWYDLELLKLRRKLARQKVWLSLVGLAALLAVVVAVWGPRYGLFLKVNVPHAGHWTLRLYRGQSRCDKQKARLLESSFEGTSGIRFFVPVGDYEGELVAGEERIEFPVRVTGLPWHWTVIDAVPPVSFQEVPGLEMVFVPGGRTNLGVEPALAGNAMNEPRVENVSPFYIARHEVTRGLFGQFVREKNYITLAESPGRECLLPPEPGSSKQVEGVGHWKQLEGPPPEVSSAELDRLPVVYVTHTDALAFADWLTEKTHRRFRLPTEDEWEAAARGLDGRTFPWGSCFAYTGTRANMEQKGWYSDRYPALAPVGMFPDGQSPVGALDMAGNVHELTESCLKVIDEKEQLFEKSTPPACAFIHVRGGGFNSNRLDIVSGTPGGPMDTEYCAYNVGFRVVMDPGG